METGKFYIDNKRKPDEQMRDDVFIYDPISDVFYGVAVGEDPIGLMLEMGELIDEAGSINALTIVDPHMREVIEQRGYER